MSDPYQTVNDAPRLRSRDAARPGPIVGALIPIGLAALLAALAVMAALAGCAAPAPKAANPLPVAPPPPKPVDPSYDWHALVPAPFGSYLKEVPLALHEVLLFRDDAPGAGKPDDAECYGTDSAAPRFVGATPDEYLLCFKQDRLARIRASVSVSTEQASEIFATACALWLKNAASATTATAATTATTAAPSIATPGAAPQSTGTCEGLDGTVHFTGRLGDEPDTSRTAGPSTVSSMPSTTPSTVSSTMPTSAPVAPSDTHEHEAPPAAAPAAATPIGIGIVLDVNADPKILSE